MTSSSSSSSINNWTSAPSSTEEAAALLASSITRLQNQELFRTTAPPPGLHSSFSTVHPLPCSELYVRLESLHAFLKQHADDVDDKDNGKLKPLAAAPSIIPLLHKILPISSNLALKPVFLHSSSNSLPPPNPLSSIAAAGANATGGGLTSPNNATANAIANVASGDADDSSVGTSTTIHSHNSTLSSPSSRTTTPTIKTPKNFKNTHNKNNPKSNMPKQLQVPPIRITPPLTSQPLRHLWIQCMTLAHRLSPPNAQPAASLHRVNSNTSSSSAHSNASGNGAAAAGGGGGNTSSAQSVLQIYLQYITGHPRSAKSSGGTRVACLGVLREIMRDDVLGPKWIRSMMGGVSSGGAGNVSSGAGGGSGGEVNVNGITLCLNGLRSSGSGDVMHRIHSIQFATSLLIAWRDTPPVYIRRKAENEPTFHYWSQNSTYLDERVLQECIKLLRKGSEDKYAEVRKAAAEFACILSSISVQDEIRVIGPPSASGGGGGGGGGANDSSSNNPGEIDTKGALNSLDDIIQICLRNIDDESAGVATVWCEALARCVCVALDYNIHCLLKLGLDQPSRSKVDDDGDGDTGAADTNSNKNDLASKLKAFAEARKAGGGVNSTSCTSIQSTMQSLIQFFFRVGGDHSASRLGGAFSVGGRHARAGISLVLVNFCKFQYISGGIGSGSGMTDSLKPLDALKMILQMVGPSLEAQLDELESSTSKTSSASRSSMTNGVEGFGIDATSSPRNKSLNEKSAMAGFFGGIGGGGKRSPSDGNVARMATNRVLRRGMLELMSEPFQVSLLRDLVSICSPPSSESNGVENMWNRHQLQVALIEISHLISALGEAASSCLDELIPALRHCLSHLDHGVRLEAAIAFQAVTVAFPNAGRKFIMMAVDAMQQHRDEIVAIGMNKGQTSTPDVAKNTPVSPKRRFRRQAKKATLSPRSEAIGKSIDHQYNLHGYALMLSMILHVLPNLPGGIPAELLDIIVSVANALTDFQSNSELCQNNPGAVCTCVRAGYCLFSGILTLGSETVLPYLPQILKIWIKQTELAESRTKHFELFHDLSCLEPVLSSIVVFLRVNSDLLLSVPDALNRITFVIEKAFPILLNYDQMHEDGVKVLESSRLDCAKSSIMEAFSWLPPGSFPLVADGVFALAGREIQSGTSKDVQCSILPCLLTDEDDVLNTQSHCRSEKPGQTGGAKTIEDHLVFVTSKCINPSEREAVVHFFTTKHSNEFSKISLITEEEDFNDAPTPLHEVGTWIRPPAPSRSSKQRLINAAIHVFAATFGMQDGQHQANAVYMLENLASTNVAAASKPLLLTERASKHEVLAATNAGAALISCLHALPLHDGSHGDIVGMGPPWMARASKFFYALLGSSCSLIRRVSAEGLGLLASLGVTEDAHTLQSSILHSLEELIRGNFIESMTPQKMSYQATSSTKASCLLTFGCLQRTSTKMIKETARARIRFSGKSGDELIYNSSTPTMIMLTRVLPHIATHTADEDSFLARTYALHSVGLLLSYSHVISDSRVSEDEKFQILSKAVEIVENNFFAAWKSNGAEVDHKHRETEKLGTEPAFMTVLMRLMSFLLPHLHVLSKFDSTIASRFSSMVAIMIEVSGCHASVMYEGMTFYERLSGKLSLMTNNVLSRFCLGKIVDNSASFVANILLPQRLGKEKYPNMLNYSCDGSNKCLRAAIVGINLLIKAQGYGDKKIFQYPEIKCNLFSLLESICGSKQFHLASIHRNVSISNDAEFAAAEVHQIESEILTTLQCLYDNERMVYDDEGRLLHWILFCRSLLTGDSSLREESSFEQGDLATVVSTAVNKASAGASQVLTYANPCRWQVKYQAAKLGYTALKSVQEKSLVAQKDDGISEPHSYFDVKKARSQVTKQQREAGMKNTDVLPSRVAFHFDDLVSTACNTAIATIDQGDLYYLQGAALRFLNLLVDCFSDVMDPDEASVSGTESKVLEQHMSQILASVKHSLSYDADSEFDSNNSQGAQTLFVSGCEILLLLINKGFISETGALKRMVRSLLPKEEELSVCAYPVSSESDHKYTLCPKPQSFVEDRMNTLWLRVAKLQTLAEIDMSSRMGCIPREYSSIVLEDIPESQESIAINCAALAIDSFRMKEYSTSTKNKLAEAEESKPILLKSGLTFKSLDNIDISVKEYMIEKWSVLSGYSVVMLLKSLGNTINDSEKQSILLTWLEKAANVIVAGLYDSLECMNNIDASPELFEESMHSCTRCLVGFSELLLSEEASDIIATKDVQNVIHYILKSVLYPCLGSAYLKAKYDEGEEEEGSQDMDNDEEEKLNIEVGDASNEEKVESTNDHRTDLEIAAEFHSKKESRQLVEQACKLLESASDPKTKFCLEFKPLMKAILLPLIALETNDIELDKTNDLQRIVLSSFIRCATNLIQDPSADSQTVKCLLPFSLSKFSSMKEEKEEKVEMKEALSLMLRTCFNMPSTSAEEKLAYIQEAAKSRDWEAWEIMCLALDEPLGIACSISFLHEALDEKTETTEHIAALSILCNVSSVRNDWVVYIMREIGADILVIMRSYGLCLIKGSEVEVNRKIICAASMKMIMFTFQNMTSQIQSSNGASLEVDAATFFSVVFVVFTEIVTFHGLPNQNSQNASKQYADPSLGQMCAHFFVHVLRVSPAIFKQCIGTMRVDNRTILETAVRADMEGYKKKEVAPVKKKLNIKSFKRN